MAASLNDAQSQWLAQLSAMRAAIAELKLPKEDEAEPAYGQDVWTDNEDSSEPTSGDDLWDLIDEEDEESFSDSSYPAQEDSAAATPAATPAYGTTWLRNRLAAISSSLTVDDLQDQIGAILGSDSSGTSDCPGKIERSLIYFR